MKIEELALKQNDDGSFGHFHSMSYDNFLTTEKALRRFYFLKLDKDIPIVRKTLEYVKKCLDKELIIPDRREKVINWDVFEQLMFTSWLTIFNVFDKKVEDIKRVWTSIIEESLINDKFSYDEYQKVYRYVFGPKGTREISPSSFYMVSLLKKSLGPKAQKAYFDFIMENGIYYINSDNLYNLPLVFDSKKTICYLQAIKIISSYANPNDLTFVCKWLDDYKNSDGYWDMPNLKPDGIIFPISDNWRKLENKLKDINVYINDVYTKII